MRKNLLSPSLLAADFSRLAEDIRNVEEAGAQYLHLDVMDGAFVPSISFGMPVIQSLRKNSNMTFDVHLMIEDPDRYLDEFAAIGADILTVHAEACTHLDRTIQKIHQLGKKAGVALNPATPLSVIEWVLPEVDMVLLMSVNPGFRNIFLMLRIRSVRSVPWWTDADLRRISKWTAVYPWQMCLPYWRPEPMLWWQVPLSFAGMLLKM